MQSNFAPNQTHRKTVVTSEGGIVAAQHVEAARVGARVLADGGNAVDAAVAASFALGVVEPWMSGLGGGGLMVVRHPDGSVDTVDCGMRAPAGLRPEDYALAEGQSEGLFAWPAVKGDANMTGPLAIAVPGLVDGIGLAHRHWGTRDWAGLLDPAIALARRGLLVDWYTSLVVGGGLGGLSQWPASRDWFLPSGVPPTVPLAPKMQAFLPAPRLAATLEALKDGARVYYDGPLADRIAADARAVGARLSRDDLSSYRARVLPPLRIGYGGGTVWATSEMSAGPTLAHVLRGHRGAGEAAAPDAAWFLSMADALSEAYRLRLSEMGDMDGRRDIGCTTHLSVVDREGRMVALTQTLLSVFGSMVTLPDTGILMNNGVFWFDPRPDTPNAIGPGKRCLANMCPVVVERADGTRLALGASGGRRILPAVAQVSALAMDFAMDLETALHHPRIDMSGSAVLTVDARFDAAMIAALSERHDTAVHTRVPYPAWFANISAVTRQGSVNTGGSEPVLPWSDAVSER